MLNELDKNNKTMAEYKCPKCGSTNVGTSTLHKAKKTLAFLGDFAAGYYGGQEAINLVSEHGGFSDIQFAKELECQACGFRWKVNDPKPSQYQQAFQGYIPQPAVDTVPDYVLDKQKHDLEDSYRSKLNSRLIWIIICVVVACLSAFYCITNNISSNHIQDTLFGKMEVPETNWLWILLFIFAVISVIIIITKSGSYNKYKRELKRLQRMSIQEFRSSWYRHQF